MLDVFSIQLHKAVFEHKNTSCVNVKKCVWSVFWTHNYTVVFLTGIVIQTIHRLVGFEKMLLHMPLYVCDVWGLSHMCMLTCSEHAMSHSVWCQVLQAKVGAKIVMMSSNTAFSLWCVLMESHNPMNTNSVTRQT